ncbi:MAG TPA: hypothetical protein VLY23_12550 [Candidatus Acidoferrum sp.]|nr:hypothetical protein [Candidatus Acidoferrum sp.]
MPRHSAHRTFQILIHSSLALALGLTFAARVISAQEPSRNYTFLVASGFLCDPDHADACPAIAKTASGDTFELSGAGTFSPHDKSVMAAGTFTRKSPAGVVIETGVWLASALVSFDSYGLAPEALRSANPPWKYMHEGSVMRTLMHLGPTAAGGLAVVRIRLFPLAGAPQNALLQVNCALGDVPRERQVEGIRLTLERNGVEFSEEVSGRVMLLVMRTEVGAPAKAPQREVAPD